MPEPSLMRQLAMSDTHPWRKVWPMLTHHGVLLLGMLILLLVYKTVQFLLAETMMLASVFVMGYLLLGTVNLIERGVRGGLDASHMPLKARILTSRLPRALSIAVVYGLLVLVALLAVLKLGPFLQRQGQALAHDWPHYVDSLSIWVRGLDVQNPLKPLMSEWVTWLQSHSITTVSRHLPQSGAVVSNASLRSIVVHQLLQVGTGTVRLAIYGLSSVVILFYVLLDGSTLKAQGLNRLPVAWHPGIERFINSFHLMASEFMVGQLILAALGGGWMLVAYSVLGVPYAGLLALLFALASFIPVIGVWIGCLPGLALLVGRGHFVDVVGLILALAGLACVRLLWCNPALFEHRQFFHPTVAIVLLLVVLQLGGLWGVLFYYPLASLLATINWLYGPNRPPDNESMVGI